MTPKKILSDLPEFHELFPEQFCPDLWQSIYYKPTMNLRVFSIWKSRIGFWNPHFGFQIKHEIRKRILLHRNLSARWISFKKSKLEFYGFANFVFVLEIRNIFAKWFCEQQFITFQFCAPDPMGNLSKLHTLFCRLLKNKSAKWRNSAYFRKREPRPLIFRIFVLNWLSALFRSHNRTQYLVLWFTIMDYSLTVEALWTLSTRTTFEILFRIPKTNAKLANT